MKVEKGLSNLCSTVHNNIVPTEETVAKLVKAFLELLKSTGFSHTAIEDFEKVDINHIEYETTNKQVARGKVDLSKDLIE